MAEEVERTLQLKITGPLDTVPAEFIEYRFCREFGCLPHQLDEMEQSKFALWLGFLKAEAATMKRT